MLSTVEKYDPNATVEDRIYAAMRRNGDLVGEAPNKPTPERQQAFTAPDGQEDVSALTVRDVEPGGVYDPNYQVENALPITNEVPFFLETQAPPIAAMARQVDKVEFGMPSALYEVFTQTAGPVERAILNNALSPSQVEIDSFNFDVLEGIFGVAPACIVYVIKQRLMMSRTPSLTKKDLAVASQIFDQYWRTMRRVNAVSKVLGERYGYDGTDDVDWMERVAAIAFKDVDALKDAGGLMIEAAKKRNKPNLHVLRHALISSWINQLPDPGVFNEHQSWYRQSLDVFETALNTMEDTPPNLSGVMTPIDETRSHEIRMSDLESKIRAEDARFERDPANRFGIGADIHFPPQQ